VNRHAPPPAGLSTIVAWLYIARVDPRHRNSRPFTHLPSRTRSRAASRPHRHGVGLHIRGRAHATAVSTDSALGSPP